MKDGKISLFVAVIVGLNAMIGAGIVTTPAMMSHQVGPAGVFSYIFSILVVLCMVLSLGKLSTLYPGKGWTYYYPKLIGGHALGIFSSICYLVGIIIAMAFVAQQAGVWLFAEFSFMESFVSASMWTMIVMGGLAALVLAGADISSLGQYIIASIVLGSLLLTSFVCLMHFDRDLAFPIAPYGLTSVFTAAPGALFAMIGFESVVSLYSMIRDPERNVERAGVLSVLAVGFIYILFSGSVLISVSPDYFSRGIDSPLPIVLSKAFPQYTFLPTAVFLGGFFAIIGTLHSIIWSGSNLLRDVIDQANFSFKFGNTASVLWVSGFMAFIAIALPAEILVNGGVAILSISYVLAVLPMFTMTLKERKLKKVFRPALAIFGGCVMIYTALVPVLQSLKAFIQ